MSLKVTQVFFPYFVVTKIVYNDCNSLRDN